MFPASFAYFAPTSLDEVIALLQEHGDAAKILAGGHSLIPLMKLRLAEPGVLIDIGRIAALRGVRRQDGRVVIGALTTYNAIDTSDRLTGLEALREAARAIGDIQVRNRGTIGGSLAHADPGADLPAAMLAYDAEIALKGPQGERTVAAEDFFQGLLTTALAEDELLTEVRFKPVNGRSGAAYLKFPNPASGYAIVGVAAVLTLDEDGAVAEARVGITGAGEQAVRARDVEAALRDKRPDRATIAAAAEFAAEGIDPLDDIHASAEYRAALARVYTKRALTAAWERAQIATDSRV